MTDLTSARARAAEARSQLRATAANLKNRVRPAALVNDALTVAQTQGRKAALAAATTPKRRPALAVAMIVGGFGYLLRKPIFSLIARLLKKENQT